MLPEEIQAELTRLAEVMSRSKAWDFHKDTHGVKGDLENKEAEFFVSHDPPEWLSRKKAHLPDPKSAASKSKTRRRPAELAEARREIIVDSGSSQHMIGLSELNETEKKTIRKLSSPFLVQTAHGVVLCDKKVKIYIHELEMWVWAGLLEDSPAVLSLGRLCSHMGFAFYWEEAADFGYLIKGGKTIKCKTVCNVPTVTVATEAETQEAKESDGTTSDSSEVSLVLVTSSSSNASSSSSSSSCSDSSWSGSESEAEGDTFDRAMAPFSHDDYDDEHGGADSDESMPSEKTSDTSSRSSSSRSGSTSQSSSGTSSAPKRSQRRLSARERRIRSRKIAAKNSFKGKHNLFTHFQRTTLALFAHRAR